MEAKIKPVLKSLKSLLGETLRSVALFPAMDLVTPVEVIGLENLKQDGTTYIFAPNHNSHLDTPSLLKAMPRPLRMHTRVAAAADYFTSWKGMAVGILLNTTSCTRQGQGCAASLLKQVALVKSGSNLVLFPEGTRSRDGHLQPFKKGIGALAQYTGAQVVPVWIEGTHKLMPKGTNFPKPGHIRVIFGKPVSYPPETAPAEIARDLESRLLKLAGIETVDAPVAA